MKLSKEAILGKTHYGIKIYAYVLRQYYPGNTVLSLSGRVCQPTKNPFNGNAVSLMVSIVDNVAIHTDANDPNFKGDAFDFAQLHFKKEGNELLKAIDETLNLHIAKPSSLYQNQNENEIIDTNDQAEDYEVCNSPIFSYFKRPISNTIPKGTVTLREIYHLIKGEGFSKATQQLRAITDVKAARAFKAKQFDYVTFSGTFTKRNDKSLRTHSGLLTLDFDHMPDIVALKETLLEDDYFETELLFISPSGDGLKWIIPIDLQTASHSDYIRSIANYIKQTYQIEIDGSGKDISRACFIPHDKDAYINPKYLR